MNAQCLNVVIELVLDGPAICVENVGEDVRRSLVDVFCHHHHYQCFDSLTDSLDSASESIEYASESGDSSECACE